MCEGFDYVLTERFCQDVLEEYFGYQWGMGRRADNPSLKEFGYNANAIAIQGQLTPKFKEMSLANITRVASNGMKILWQSLSMPGNQTQREGGLIMASEFPLHLEKEV